LHFRFLFAYNDRLIEGELPEMLQPMIHLQEEEGCMSTQPLTPPIANALGVRIRQLRKKRGWRQAEFALICGLHRSHMGKIERGETNLRLSSLLMIARSLETTVHNLLEGIA
jgi:DNA-binding XRE family transcriptional regulator